MIDLGLELAGAFLAGFAVCLLALGGLVYRQLRRRGLWTLVVTAARSSRSRPGPGPTVVAGTQPVSHTAAFGRRPAGRDE